VFESVGPLGSDARKALVAGGWVSVATFLLGVSTIVLLPGDRHFLAGPSPFLLLIFGPASAAALLLGFVSLVVGWKREIAPAPLLGGAGYFLGLIVSFFAMA
jgi:hypothetical protein